MTYQDGDPRPARILLTNGDWLELSDYFWSNRTYLDVLTEVGFTDLQVAAPLLADAYGLADPADLNAWDYDAERTHAPMILIHGCRPGDWDGSRPKAGLLVFDRLSYCRGIPAHLEQAGHRRHHQDADDHAQRELDTHRGHRLQRLSAVEEG